MKKFAVVAGLCGIFAASWSWAGEPGTRDPKVNKRQHRQHALGGIEQPDEKRTLQQQRRFGALDQHGEQPHRMVGHITTAILIQIPAAVGLPPVAAEGR